MVTDKDSAGVARGRRQRVQAAATGMAVLNALASLGGRASLTALSRNVGESPAKVHRYLISMIEERLVDQDPISLHYYLGAGAIQVGLAAMRQADPLRMSESALVRLRESLEMTCFIAVMGNKGPTIVRFEEPGLPITLNVRVGSVLSLLWSATGRVFLAYLDDSTVGRLAREEMDSLSPSQQFRAGSPDMIDILKREVRDAGMAIVRDTNLAGVSAVSVPVFDFANRLGAVLTVLGTSGGFETDPSGHVAQVLRKECAAISAALGYVA